MGDIHAGAVGRPIRLSIAGMTCGGCANTVRRVLSQVSGVTSAEVDLAGGTALVEGAAQGEDLVAAVEAAGFTAALAELSGCCHGH